MAKIKLNFRVISSFGFWLCCLVLSVASNDSNSNQADGSELSLILQRLEALESQNVELKKVVEDLNKRIESIESQPQKNCDEEIESLKNKLNQLESNISSDHGVWFLTKPIRGPPGKNGIQGAKGDPGLAPWSITSCSDAMEIFPSPRSKKQWIYPHGNTRSVQVLCDFENDGGGWTLIQKRSSGPREEFDRNWTEYQNGFGSLDGNFWIGLENIRALTKNGDQELRIELEDFEGVKRFAKYSNFSISDASDFYRISIGGFSGNGGDSMNYHNQRKFSTRDQDNDKDGCAARYKSGWWFSSCFDSNLNGLYRNKGDTASDAKGIIWYNWKNEYYSLAKTEMKIRKRK